MITAEVVFSAFFWVFVIIAILVLVAVTLDMRPPYEERQARKCDRRAARTVRRACSKHAGPDETELYFAIARYWRHEAKEWRRK